MSTFPVRMIDSDILVFGSTSNYGEPTEDSNSAELPPEFYLREFLELDATDPDAILAFCERWGPVGKWDCSDLPGLPFGGPFAQDADHEMPDPWHPLLWGVQTNKEIAQSLHSVGFRSVECIHSVGRVAVYQDSLRNAVLLWQFASGDIDAAALAAEARPLGEEIPLIGSSREELREIDASRASFNLACLVNVALEPFHVRLELHTNEHLPLGTPFPNVYQASCLQLVNHVCEGAVYRRCENETCGRLFVRQRGGSRIAQERGEAHGQYHATGIKYCSPQCARAQAARAMRRRKRAARRKGESA